MEKKCSKCKEVKPFESFGKASWGFDGRQAACRTCLNELQRTQHKRQTKPPPFDIEMCLWWLRQA